MYTYNLRNNDVLIVIYKHQLLNTCHIGLGSEFTDSFRSDPTRRLYDLYTQSINRLWLPTSSTTVVFISVQNLAVYVYNIQYSLFVYTENCFIRIIRAFMVKNVKMSIKIMLTIRFSCCSDILLQLRHKILNLQNVQFSTISIRKGSLKSYFWD